MKISYLGNLTSTFLLLTSFFCVQSAPARPLNERSTEFAWVLLDEQQSDSSPRRKITPKSIFISPSFGSQSCSSGYTLDANGRCIKVVKLDTSAHEQFVLELLNQNFGNYEDYDDEGEEGGDEPLPTPGPFQFNIPLNVGPDQDKISIIVAPTNGQFEDTMKIEKTKKTSQLDAPLIITKIDINDGDQDHVPHKPNNATTTPTPGDERTKDDMSTSTTPNEDLHTIATEPYESTTELEIQQAIFFKIPTSTVKPPLNEEDIAVTDVNLAQTTFEDNEDTPSTTHSNTIRFPDRPTFDEALFQDFLQDMKKQVNRRFVTKTNAQANSQDVLYNNHRNRDRWLFPRFLDHEQKRSHR